MVKRWCLGLYESVVLRCEFLRDYRLTHPLNSHVGVSLLLDVFVSHVDVVLRRVGLREEVCTVGLSPCPHDPEVALFPAVADPMVAHVDCLAPADLHGVVGDPDGGDVVGEYRCPALGVSEVVADVAESLCSHSR